MRRMSMAEVLQGENSVIGHVAPVGPFSAVREMLDIPLDDVILRNIWEKAAKIVSSPGAVQCAPFFPGKQAEDCDTFLVISESSSENFHTVKCGSSVSGIIKCSCPGFKLLGVCSHAVAVAEQQGLLSK